MEDRLYLNGCLNMLAAIQILLIIIWTGVSQKLDTHKVHKLDPQEVQLMDTFEVHKLDPQEILMDTFEVHKSDIQDLQLVACHAQMFPNANLGGWRPVTPLSTTLQKG